MALPMSLRVPIPHEYVFPHKALFQGVEPVLDFDKPKDGDRQARDENGLRLWHVRAVDQDPEATKFGRSAEVKVKVAAEVQPVPPAPQVPGFPPLVHFEDLTVTPYVESRKCTDSAKSRCRARIAYSLRASGITADTLPTPDEGR